MESRTHLPPPAADALFRAARDHATGWLTFASHGAEARLYLQAGDVVGARLGYGYQTLAQSLLAAGLLDLATLDELWARGEAGSGAEALVQASGGDAAAATQLQTLASVRRLVAHGGEATFMPALVDVTMPRVAGARAVRAAFETLGPLLRGALACCRDVAACEGWLLGVEERELLAGFAAFRPVGELSPGQAALFRLLQHDGRVEILDPAGFEARSAAELAAEQQRAEEDARRAVARAAIESARQAEETRRAEQRQRAEQARRALDQARAAEAAWREAQAHLPRTDTPIEEALADTVVRGRPHTVESTDAGTLHPVEPTDPAFPQHGFDEPLVDVPRITAAEAMDTTSLPEPDTLRPLVVQTGRRDTLETYPVAGERAEPPPPARTDTEEPVIIPAAGTPKRRDTLRPFQSPDLPPPVQLSETVAEPVQLRPSGSTPIWGTERDERAAEDTLLRSAESIELIPMPGPADASGSEMEPILLVPESEIPSPTRTPEDLVREMTEALRRSGTDTVAEDWLAATDGVVAAGPSTSTPTPPSPPPVVVPEISRPPLRLGPAAAAPEDDLWRIVQAPAAPAPAAAAASFEEALANVDAHLSSLVGLDEHPTEPGLPVDAILRASADAGSWTMETLPPSPEPPPPAPASMETTPALTPSGGGEPGEAARERRQRLLRRAIQNLGSLVSRSPRTMGSATPLEPTPAPVSIPLAPRTPAEEAFARQIEERFIALSGERNRFEILGLDLDASREQVKRAYLDLVKAFHPDRLPPGLANLVPKATAIFDSLRDAHDVLQDDERRGAHALEMSAVASGRPLRDQAEAAEAFRAGEVALRRRDHAAAEAHFAEAYRLHPRASVLAARAWAIYMDPNRKSDAAGARAMMVDALKEDPTCDRAHYQLGVIARVEGDVDRAERHFREALKANPRHLESSQELRLIEMRKRGGPTRKPR